MLEGVEVYIAATILFLIPLLLILCACIRVARSRREETDRNWRTVCRTAALFLAMVAIATGIVSNFSWLHNGGSPHGMGASSGIWRPLRPVFWMALAATSTLSIVGKGKGRLLTLGAMLATLIADLGVVVLNMD
jgi:hypothetical protein